MEIYTINVVYIFCRSSDLCVPVHLEVVSGPDVAPRAANSIGPMSYSMCFLSHIGPIVKPRRLTAAFQLNVAVTTEHKNPSFSGFELHVDPCSCDVASSH